MPKAVPLVTLVQEVALNPAYVKVSVYFATCS